jgi:hypothetical protein
MLELEEEIGLLHAKRKIILSKACTSNPECPILHAHYISKGGCC